MSGLTIPDAELLQAGFRYAFSLSSERHDAEDLVHDAWLRLVKRYGGSPDKPLLFRTIRNLYIDTQRREKLSRQYRDANQYRSEDQVPDIARDFVSSSEMQHHLSKLRDHERELLYLSAVEGYTADEIASMTESVRGSVLSTLFRAKKKLRGWLDDSDANTPGSTTEIANRSKVVKFRARKNQS